jgi:hypothetical protein
MISAPNLLLPLSGNKFVLSLVVMFLLFACSSAKPVTKSQDVQVVKASVNKSNGKEKVLEKQNDENHVVTKETKANPSSDIRVKIKSDTVNWSIPLSAKPPITILEKKKAALKKGPEFKEQYSVKLLIPLNSDVIGEPSQSRFVHFYAGFLKALEVLDEEDVKLSVKVIDTEEGNYKVKEKINDIFEDDVDLIIGPFERDDLKVLAEECRQRGIPLISPWQTSTKITYENPFYVQMKPNLKEHYLKLAENMLLNFQKGEVAIIGKNTKETNSWIKYFQDAAFNSKGISDFFSTYFITNDSLSTGGTAFRRLYNNSKIKALILPNFSYNDEDFIYSCLRKLSAEKGQRQISLYGMPILYDSEKIEFDYYQSLQIKVVLSDFIDEDQNKIREFRRKYLDMYGEIPSADAFKGFDLMLYIGRNLYKYGRNFQNYLQFEPTRYLQSNYDIRKAKSEDSILGDDPQKFDFYENKHLDIIEFKGNKWQIKRN